MSSKSKTRKSAPRRPRITAEQFDAKFDAGEDIIEYLDLEKARIFAPGKERPAKAGLRSASGKPRTH
jgi:hypothetical protein